MASETLIRRVNLRTKRAFINPLFSVKRFDMPLQIPFVRVDFVTDMAFGGVSGNVVRSLNMSYERVLPLEDFAAVVTFQI